MAGTVLESLVALPVHLCPFQLRNGPGKTPVAPSRGRMREQGAAHPS